VLGGEFLVPSSDPFSFREEEEELFALFSHKQLILKTLISCGLLLFSSGFRVSLSAGPYFDGVSSFCDWR